MKIEDKNGAAAQYFDEYTPGYSHAVKTAARWVSTGQRRVLIKPTRMKIGGERILEIHMLYRNRPTLIRVTDADWQYELRQFIDTVLPDANDWYVVPKPFVDAFMEKNGPRVPWELPNAKGERMPLEVMASG